MLHTLTEKDLLRCIAPKGSVPRYELQRNRNHHHLVCRNCCKIIDVKCKNPNPPCLDIDNAYDFIIDEAEVTFWGICPKCQELDPSHLKSEKAPVRKG
ncbi:Fur family transcriptional regulator [Arcanobacterium hippocoleae]|uniref:Fur family transcriptional regulator n=1 Tax=Arcanobacterium hippocoleae TaxID=149017 RepID=UPI00333F1763